MLTKSVELENWALTPNSRSYLNRWIQPDTIIPDPYDPLNYDRYSYVRNNPLKYSDPSGHCAELEGKSDGLCVRFNEKGELAQIVRGGSHFVNYTEVAAANLIITGNEKYLNVLPKGTQNSRGILKAFKTANYELGNEATESGGNLLDRFINFLDNTLAKNPTFLLGFVGGRRGDYLRGKDAAEAAAKLGYTRRIPPQRAPINTHGQSVFYNPETKTYISIDVDSHNSVGVWKMFDREWNRIGTFDAQLNMVGK